MRFETMTESLAVVALLFATSCKQQRGIDGDHGESEKLAVSGGLERVQGPKISFTEAIRLAGEREKGFVPVAASAEEGEDEAYRIALLSRGRVKEIAVDSKSGKVTEIRERPVREGSEGFAAGLEKELPAAKFDLSRAVGIAISHAPEGPGTARALGAQIDLDEGQLIYGVTLGIGTRVIEVAIDASSGEVLDVSEGGVALESMDPEESGSAERQEALEPPPTELNFDGVPAGLLPDRWKVEATGKGDPLATWKIVADASAPSKGNALALVSANHDSTSTFNLCWTDEIRFQDGSIEASFKPVSGRDDQGGGLIWRAKSKDDYYVCRANPLEDNFRLYFVKDGRRTELASADAVIAAGTWHRIRIEQEGEHIRCSLDGVKLLDTIDSTFPDAGGVGFWTKADAVTSFDDLRVSGSTRDRSGEEERDDEKGEKEEDER